MKRIKLSLICTAALMLALPLAGCGRGDSGNTTKQGVEQRIVTQTEENGDCPDGKCPNEDNKCPDGKCPKEDNECPDGKCPKEDNECPDGKCPKKGEECPDGRCPKKRLPPRGRHGGSKRAVKLPAPILNDENK